ncbi:hypothetical protein N7466_007350 [Penicillium verhagenii]|uniref:uncharacterized protein n=1 Tax=Penicillium verhagenii TaxID=1562060 RepID=UPI0025456B40|nr:uncharacterized protein N7466_007350 [Penicillium verhagenii]KAJ5928394.1 hypothetical protein N7466_007350 [Penicillium verhagenii]
MADRDTALRDVKLFIREVVRTDWEFTADPNGPNYISLPSEDDDSIGTLHANRPVLEWRSREFDSSGSELEPPSSDDESESDIPTANGDPEIDLRRKRRRQMDEEMAWNEGLRMWMARRDVWSGARTRRQIQAKEKKDTLLKTQTSEPAETGVDSRADSGVDAGAALPQPRSVSPHSDPQSQNEATVTDAPGLVAKMNTSMSIAEREKTEDCSRRQDQDEEQSTAPEDEAKRKESTQTSITEPESSGEAPDFSAIDDDEEEYDEELDEPLIPVAPPFLSPENPIRATINSSIYPSIYTKVVVQGMTPTVPVNLADLTKAMVQGWKADGQWPPKPAVTSIVLEDTATVKRSSDTTDAPQSRRKNSITNAMRKVFHLGSHPFHRHGSTSQDGGSGAAPGSGSVI